MSEYSLEAYGDMISNRLRFDAYVQAMRQTIRPGDIVLDIGTGTGIFALLAAQLGARHVYAVESSDAVQLGRECAAASGLADAISFHQGLSTDLRLPERADVIVSDLRGVLPLHDGHLAAIIDARQRLLKPGGRLIPLRDTVKAAIVSNAAVYEQLTSPWDGQALGLDLKPALRLATHRWRSAVIGKEDLVTAPAELFTLDYHRIDAPGAAGSAELTVERGAVAQGLAVWFDALLADGISFTTAPGAPRLVYGHAFFPWPQAVPLSAGDRAEIALRADSIGGHYEWRWRTRLRDDSGKVRATFDQSSFDGRTFSLDRLRRRAADARPLASSEGRALAMLLALFDGTQDLTGMAEVLVGQFPEQFPTLREALDFAAEASVRFGRWESPDSAAAGSLHVR
ncbi:MAG TPA: 50S ribosomal protein L11 methyltransferase [Anaerolineae bacterium]|nr:50S ribosomal protein L11 methyltransferase [Anaerolineae bacterium]